MRTITVKGIGNLALRPDYVELSMRLETRDKEYSKSMETATKQLSQLTNSLVSIDFKKDALKTTDFNVYTDYENVRDGDDNFKRVFTGFVCNHQLKLAFDFDMERLSQVLSTISSCLAQPELNIAFTVKEATAVNEALLKAASRNAKRKAELLCEASDVKLGQLLTIDYNWSELKIISNTQFKMGDNCMRGTAKAMHIEPDDINVRDTATFIWEIA